MGQSADKCIQHRRQEVRVVERRPSRRIANLLLVVPAFCKLAGKIEPDGRRFRTRPGNRAADLHWIESGKARLHLRPAESEKFAEQARARAAHCQHPFGIQPIHEFDQLGVAVDFRIGSKAIALAREDPDIAAQKVCDDILDRPSRRGCRPRPIIFIKLRQQCK